MFKIEKSPSYWWPVDVYKPSATTAGELVLAGTFEVQFRWMDEDELDAFNEAVQKDGLRDSAAAARLVTGWRGVADAEGKDVVFSPEELKAFLQQPVMGTRIVRAFYASRGEAARKN